VNNKHCRERSDSAWICTYTGRKFFPLDPNPDDISIMDIAHALSNQCRFAGHTLRNYSVAEHSIYVSKLCDPQDALDGLLHDAPEAYLVDLPRPIKNSPGFEAYHVAERDVHYAVSKAFGTKEVIPVSVHFADIHLSYTEARDLMSPEQQWFKSEDCYKFHIPTDERKASEVRDEFLDRFYELVNKKDMRCLDK
jgi:5'-deoxynucleotidase YfbR-like HD superfamily hydrolase